MPALSNSIGPLSLSAIRCRDEPSGLACSEKTTRDWLLPTATRSARWAQIPGPAPFVEAELEVQSGMTQKRSPPLLGTRFVWPAPSTPSITNGVNGEAL